MSRQMLLICVLQVAPSRPGFNPAPCPWRSRGHSILHSARCARLASLSFLGCTRCGAVCPDARRSLADFMSEKRFWTLAIFYKLAGCRKSTTEKSQVQTQCTKQTTQLTERWRSQWWWLASRCRGDYVSTGFSPGCTT